MPPQQQYTWQQICLGKNSGNKITVIHSHHARSPLWPQVTQNLCCLFPVNHPSFFPFFLSLQSPGLVELGGGERSAVCCLKVSHVLPRLRQREREKKNVKRQQGWRRNGKWEVWEGNEQKVQNLIILVSVCMALCHTNLFHLLRVYRGGE